VCVCVCVCVCVFVCVCVCDVCLFALQQHVHPARTQALWDNYWPGSRAIKARYQRVKAMIDKRNKGLHQAPDWDPSGHKNLADPVKFCQMSFPPDSFYNQDEFHACLDAIGAKLVRLNVGDSKIATDITGAPAGLYQPDGAFVQPKLQ
jgi:hypothetical protein